VKADRGCGGVSKWWGRTGALAAAWGMALSESVSEEYEIYTDYDGCHSHHVKHDSYLSAHFRFLA